MEYISSMGHINPANVTENILNMMQVVFWQQNDVCILATDKSFLYCSCWCPDKPRQEIGHMDSTPGSTRSHVPRVLS